MYNKFRRSYIELEEAGSHVHCTAEGCCVTIFLFKRNTNLGMHCKNYVYIGVAAFVLK